MSPRQRKGKSRGLPPHLFARKDRRSGKTYYRYRGPDGRWYGMGTDRADAVRQAVDANLRRYEAPDELWQRITQEDAPTVAQWCERYFELMEGRGLRPNTLSSARSRLKRIAAGLGDVRLPDLTTRHCAGLLQSLNDEGKARMAQAIRSTLKDMLNEAIAEGHIGHNVALVTRQTTVEVKRQRLTLEAWQAIHEAAAGLDPWVRRSMELALVSGQPREVIGRALFSDIKEDAWWAHRGKTGAQIMIPLALRLDAVDMSLRDVVTACRDAVVSRNLIHHSRRRTKSRPGDPVHIDTISRGFARARERAGITGEAPPSFHEIRSLSERLYHRQGIDTQALLGHKDPRTTAIYRDGRGAEWIRVQVG